MLAKEQYLELYQQKQQLIHSQSVPLLNACREKAFFHLQSKGFPTKKDERYKYTNIEALFEPNFGLNLKRIPIQFNPYTAYRCPIDYFQGTNYYVINDTFCEPSEEQRDFPKGVLVKSFDWMAEHKPELLEEYYAKQASIDDALTALNTLYVQDGLFIYVPKGVKVDKPIQVINIAYSRVDFLNNRRVIIVLEEESEANVLFCDHARQKGNFLNTQVTEIYVKPSARLNLSMLEETQSRYSAIHNTYLVQYKNSYVNINSVMLHGGISRNYLYLNLAEEGAQIDCFGCVVGDEKQHIDNHILIHHKAPKCESNVVYKYLLDDEAVGAFVGHILVDKDAQQTYSEETNANMCISKKARMYTRPMLEIYADDVKCNHGATVGQLDETALFYMQQRGVPAEEARILLQHAFINDIINRIPIPDLREHLSTLVEKRCRGEKTSCSATKSCGLCAND